MENMPRDGVHSHSGSCCVLLQLPTYGLKSTICSAKEEVASTKERAISFSGALDSRTVNMKSPELNLVLVLL